MQQTSLPCLSALGFELPGRNEGQIFPEKLLRKYGSATSGEVKHLEASHEVSTEGKHREPELRSAAKWPLNSSPCERFPGHISGVDALAS